MTTMDEATAIAGRIDERYLTDTLVELAKVPTDVPLGPQTFIEPDHPKLVHYVQQVLRPKIQALGDVDLQDVPRNQLVVRLGDGSSGPCLLVMVYVPTQHHQLMEEPFSGKTASGAEWGYDEPCVFGQGVGQNKSQQAVMLAVIKLLVEEKVRLPGTVYFAVNNEGRSSHACTESILASLEHKPQFAMLLQRTGLGISLGNRGRLDINVEVRGKAVHSSVPAQGLSAIEGANQVLNRLKQIPLDGKHPILGVQHAVAYQVVYEPIAPHTLPDVARLKIDRRLLPGDDVDQAVSDVRDAIGDMSPYQVTVERSTHMLPALVDPNHRGVQVLKESHRQILGEEPVTYYGTGTFDAGGPCAAGVPAVMYGSGGGRFPLWEDFVPISQVITQAKVVAHTILSFLQIDSKS